MPDFDTNYPQNPWADITTKERPWYFPQLYSVYRRAAIYNRFVQTQFNHNGPRATEMFMDSLLMPHANHDSAGLRDLWGNATYMDTFRRKITFSRYNGKFSMNKYDDMVSFYLRDGVRGLSRIINEGLGYHVTEVLDKLARDAFLRAPFALYGNGSHTGVDFGDILTTDTLSTTLLDDIQLGMKERDVPGVTTGNGSPGSIVCVTSPGALRDLRYEASQGGNANAWIDVMKYADATRIINGEVGSYHGVRFVETPRAILYNVGEVDTQVTITAAVSAGDGSPDPATTQVDTVEYVGQPGATHYITVSDSSGFTVGDIVTIHVDRTSDFGVTNGADYRDGHFTTRRVVSKPSGTRIAFDRPILEDLSTDLGGGVYGYVTLGSNIHTALFLAGNDGVVQGVAQAPMIHTPAPVDDFDMIYRFTWDAYLGYQVFNKDVFEVAYLAGSNRVTGGRYIR